MSTTFATFGNDLHAGRRILPIVSRRRTWYLISVVVVVLLGALAVVRGPNLGIEFTGGSEFQIAGVADTEQSSAREVVREHLPDNEPKVTQLGGDTLRVQTEQLDSTQTAELAGELAAAYEVPADAVSTSYIGPVWSGDVTQKMARGVVVFLVLVAAMMALYFRDLKASLAAMIALGHDMLLSAAVYGVVGFEITPGTVIGFLTVMGYSLYDTIVVFDKVRENTVDLTGQRRRTFAELVELAANQTLVRSINTSVVALLPIGSILAIGAFLLGAGTLKDISLALFIGIIAGTYSSIFLAPGLLVDLRRREDTIARHTLALERARRGETGSTSEDSPGSPRGEDAATRADGADLDAVDPDAADPADADAADEGEGRTPEADPADEDDGTVGRAAAPRSARQQPRRTTRRRRSGR
ncbi:MULTISPECIES: protein translocase subunit SecF [Brachybacterium]|uniref:Protein-export membrane protein SecF n=2 Tax=Brachybacterium TaxID=43668 RepID=A0A3R8SMW4_9MICO|nr:MULTISPECIES: protein translocase subunit SecF [Brachybacterium]RRR17107.1 protein translocase subunit SecF [Brachybacterium paraconglomeratum]GLI31634.1 protein-export membrane protein SecF [Brachybacterium conglomeratum]GLK06346.1 protein-export membrane protein SecF [Brachybacterium conglomeratum]